MAAGDMFFTSCTLRAWHLKCCPLRVHTCGSKVSWDHQKRTRNNTFSLPLAFFANRSRRSGPWSCLRHREERQSTTNCSFTRVKRTIQESVFCFGKKCAFWPFRRVLSVEDPLKGLWRHTDMQRSCSLSCQRYADTQRSNSVSYQRPADTQRSNSLSYQRHADMQ